MARTRIQIKQQRVLHEMSQAELAEKIGVTRQTISSWEKGTSFPDVEMLEKLAMAFDVRIEELLYPVSESKHGALFERPIGMKFLAITTVFFFIAICWGGCYIGIPLFRSILGGNIQDEYYHIICWGILCLAVHITLCAYFLQEFIAQYFERGDMQEKKEENRSQP